MTDFNYVPWQWQKTSLAVSSHLPYVPRYTHAVSWKLTRLVITFQFWSYSTWNNLEIGKPFICALMKNWSNSNIKFDADAMVLHKHCKLLGSLSFGSNWNNWVLQFSKCMIAIRKTDLSHVCVCVFPLECLCSINQRNADNCWAVQFGRGCWNRRRCWEVSQHPATFPVISAMPAMASSVKPVEDKAGCSHSLHPNTLWVNRGADIPE